MLRLPTRLKVEWCRASSPLPMRQQALMGVSSLDWPKAFARRPILLGSSFKQSRRLLRKQEAAAGENVDRGMLHRSPALEGSETCRPH